MSKDKRAYEFIAQAIKIGAFTFGQFELKSGRSSPYFFDIAKFNTGERAHFLGRCYVQAILEHRLRFDCIYGPAYKGISLAASVASVYYQETERDVPFTSDRKEVKDHGERGIFVGTPPAGNTLIVDDVVTTAQTKIDAAYAIRENGASVAGVVVAFDRQEYDHNTETTATQELGRTLHVSVVAIATQEDLLRFLDRNERTVVPNQDGKTLTARQAADKLRAY